MAQDSGAILESPNPSGSSLTDIAHRVQIIFSPEGNLQTIDIIATESGALAPVESGDLPDATQFKRPENRPDKKGKLVLPPHHQDVALSLSDRLSGELVRDVDDPFHWVGTHWVPRNPKNFKRYICHVAQCLRLNEAKLGELNSIYECFMNTIESLPESQTFYQQNPFLANFLDGTLEVVKGSGGEYTKRFREHRKEDFLTWVLPYEYMAPRPQNELFNEWLIKAFADDKDGAGKVRALKQIGGACLISLFPRIAILLSHQGGTGKSTFAKLCMKFMGKENYSSVPPHLMKEFLMESMIGKQANIVTDIGKKGQIPEDFMKLVEDSLPILVNRKGRPAIQARIPALHLFCANALPGGIDGESTAMDRRVTIVEFTKSVLGDDGQSYTRDYEEVLMRAGSGAILQFFEEGLDDLLESGGLYFNPESGRARLKEWKDAESFTAQLLLAIEYGEIGPLETPFELKKEGSILRRKLSDAIEAWSGRAISTKMMHGVFAELERRGFVGRKTNGFYFISGIAEKGHKPDLF